MRIDNFRYQRLNEWESLYAAREPAGSDRMGQAFILKGELDLKKVLWVSRHEMTAAQRADLERALGDQINLDIWADTVRDIEALRPQVEAADAVAVVLPPELLQAILPIAGEKPVLRAVSGREATGKIIKLEDGREEQEFAFVHLFWEQILCVDIRTRRL